MSCHHIDIVSEHQCITTKKKQSKRQLHFLYPPTHRISKIPALELVYKKLIDRHTDSYIPTYLYNIVYSIYTISNSFSCRDI